MKRIYYIFILCIVCTFVISCGKKQDVKMSDKQDIKVSDKQEKETENVKNATLQTEYHIEDYENGYLIVSKSDGLLYGVIDRNNKNIIPVEYDEITFEGTDLKSGKQFFCAKYEDKYTLFDNQGEKLIENADNIISKAEYETMISSDVPLLFKSKSDGQINFYTESGIEKGVIKFEDDDIDIFSFERSVKINQYEEVNENLVLISTFNSSTGVFNSYLYNYEGKLLKTWDKCAFKHCNTRGDSGNEYYVYMQSGDWETDKIYIDQAGNCKIVDHYTKDTWMDEYNRNEKKVQINTYPYHVGTNKENTISWSNGTWKYQTASGDIVYDARYYSCLKIDTAYLLSNENKEACVITENGKKVLDYGNITYEGDENYYYQDIKLDDKNFFSDFKSVCIVTKDNQQEVAHFFEEQD